MRPPNKKMHLEEADPCKKKLIKQVLEYCKIDKDISEAIYHNEIQNLKDNKILFNENKKISKFSSIERLDDIYSFYQQRLIEINAVDFGDILLHSYTILFNNEDIRNSYKKFIEHILIDEFQDTNLIQYDLIKLIIPVLGGKGGGGRNTLAQGGGSSPENSEKAVKILIEEIERKLNS